MVDTNPGLAKMTAKARPIRIECAGAWYHITARGNERREVYRRHDRDRQHFCALPAEMWDRPVSYHIS